MDHRAQIEERFLKIRTPKIIFLKKLVRHKFHNQPWVYESFFRILTEYTYCRLDPDDMYLEVSRLFCAYPEIIKAFRRCFTRAVSTRDDYAQTSRPAKKAKTEDDSSKGITVIDPTSNGSTSYASDYSQSVCSSGCHPLKSEAVASYSSSSQSPLRNAAEAYEAQKKELVEFIDGKLYVTETKTKLVDGPQANEHFTELVNQIDEKRLFTHAIMERASNLLQGYPELIESFNGFLPKGFRIVVLSDDYEMSTD